MVFSIFMELCSYHHRTFENICIVSKRSPVPLGSRLFTSCPPTLGNYFSTFSCYIDLPVLDISCGIMQYVIFCDRLPVLCTVFSEFGHVVCVSVLCSCVFLLLSHCGEQPHFLYPCLSWWTLGCFHSLAVMNNAAVALVCRFLRGHVFSFLECDYV